MFKHILIPTDGSDLSRKAILYGVQLAKETGAKVTAIKVTEPYQRRRPWTRCSIPMDRRNTRRLSRACRRGRSNR